MADSWLRCDRDSAGSCWIFAPRGARFWPRQAVARRRDGRHGWRLRGFGPDFTSAPVAPSRLEWRNKSLKTGDYEYRDWWRVFRDPVLDRLITTAFEQNLTAVEGMPVAPAGCGDCK
jgi:hypothetical protein